MGEKFLFHELFVLQRQAILLHWQHIKGQSKHLSQENGGTKLL